MEFRILGPLEVLKAGSLLPLGGPKRRALLALLLLHADAVVSSDKLVDELWGEKPPATAIMALHNHVSRLRKVLGDGILVRRPPGYVLLLDRHDFDLDCFQRLVAEAGDVGAAERATKLREALALWRGRPLEDVELPLAQPELLRLEELRLAALEERIQSDLALGRDAALVPELEALVVEYPLRERLRGQLIVALYRCGRQAEALAVYREGRHFLADELGLEPSPELRELERSILRQDPRLALPASPSGSLRWSSSGPPESRLPPRWRRLLLALAILVALASSAVALAPALNRGSTSRRDVSPTAPPIASGAYQEEGRTSTEQRRTKQPKRSASSPTSSVAHSRPPKVDRTPGTQKSRAGGTVHVETRTQAVRRRTPPQTEPPPQTPQPARPTPPEQPAPAKGRSNPRRGNRPPAKPIQISDDFSGLTRDGKVWDELTFGTSVGLAQTGGRVVVSIGPDAVPGGPFDIIDGHYSTRCKFPGDFDARIDFALLGWPVGDGVFAGLAAFFTSSEVGRQSTSNGTEQYASWVHRSWADLPQPDMSGSVRIRRVKGVVTTYVWHTDHWLALASGAETATAVIGPHAVSNRDQFRHHGVQVAFDNFVVTAPRVSCPPGSDPRSA